MNPTGFDLSGPALAVYAAIAVSVWFLLRVRTGVKDVMSPDILTNTCY
jgi:hypothetical protein